MIKVGNIILNNKKGVNFSKVKLTSFLSVRIFYKQPFNASKNTSGGFAPEMEYLLSKM